MVKLNDESYGRFIKKPDSSVRAMLVFGPNGGLVSERFDEITRLVVGKKPDPFLICDLSQSDITADPARLADEAQAMSLMATGKRIVRISGADNNLTPAIKGWATNPVGDAFVLIAGGNLKNNTSLRNLFEKNKHLACVPCYEDSPEKTKAFVMQHLQQQGYAIDSDALDYLVANTGADRKQTRSELEKLCLYMGEDKQVKTRHVLASVGDSAALSMTDLCFAVASGEMEKATATLDHLYHEGTHPVGLIRALSGHFNKLFDAQLAREKGMNDKQIWYSLRPPLPYMYERPFMRQMTQWPLVKIRTALSILLDCEKDCKSTGIPAETVFAHAVMRLTNAARKRSTR